MRQLTILALLLTAAAPALAKRVAVVTFEGPQAEAAEKAVVDVLTKEGHELVRGDEWKAVLAEIGAKPTPEEAFAAAAKRVKVGAIVIGKVQPPPKRNKPGLLVLTVHDGKTGAKLESVEVPLKRGKVDAAATTTIALNLPPVVTMGQEPVLTPEPAAPVTADTETPEAIAARHAARIAASQPKPVVVERKRTIAVAGLGLNLWGRRMTVTPAGSADAYDGGPMPPGIHLEVEGYPAAKFTSGIAGDFGLGAYFSGAWLKSKFPGESDVSTTYLRGGVDVRFRHRFLPDHPFGPTVRGSIAFNYVGFKLAASGRAAIPSLNLPDVSLYGIGPVAAVVVPLGRPWLRAGARFGGYYVTGGDGNAPSGGRYDGGYAIETAVHVDWLPLRWLQVRAELGINHYGSSIAAAPTTGVADTYFSGLLTASYVY